LSTPPKNDGHASEDRSQGAQRGEEETRQWILKRLRNLGPWPVTVDIMEWQFYPALIGPSAFLDALHGTDVWIRARDHNWSESSGKNLRNSCRLRDSSLQNPVCGIAQRKTIDLWAVARLVDSAVSGPTYQVRGSPQEMSSGPSSTSSRGRSSAALTETGNKDSSPAKILSN